MFLFLTVAILVGISLHARVKKQYCRILSMEMYYIMNQIASAWNVIHALSNKVCFLMLCSWCQCVQLYSVFRPEVTGLLKTKSSHAVSGVNPVPWVKRICLMYITLYCTSASLSSLLKSGNGNVITHTEAYFHLQSWAVVQELWHEVSHSKTSVIKITWKRPKKSVENITLFHKNELNTICI